MSLNKRWVILDQCVSALKEGRLKEYYGKSDMLYFENDTCSLIFNMHMQGKTDDEILKTINL
jgi:hypothetical protein